MKSLILSFLAFFVASSAFAQNPQERYESLHEQMTKRREATDKKREQASSRIRELQFIDLSHKALQKLADEKQAVLPMDYTKIEWDLSQTESNNRVRNQMKKMERFGYGHNSNNDLCEVKLEQTVYEQNSTVKVNALAVCLIQNKEVVFQASSGVEADARNNFGYGETFVNEMSNFIQNHQFRNLLAVPGMGQAL